MTIQSPTSNDEKKSFNIFRDSSLRYLGYANEVGESFRYQYPRFVVPSYVIAFGYCCCDAVSSGYREFNNSNVEKDINSSMINDSKKEAAIAAFDTLLWQSLASVAIPGGTINVIVRATRFVASKSIPSIAKNSPTVAGLISIPIIIHPIDQFTDYLMDNTIRQYYGRNPSSNKK